MKAAVINSYGSPDVIEISEIDMPVYGDDDVLIEVKASSINPIDWKTRKGNLKYALGTHFPIVLGYDAAGIVKKTGSNVNNFMPGDKVYGRLDKKYGKALAEYAVGNKSVFAKIPENISFTQAAAVPLACLTALQGLRDKGKVTHGSEVLIIGATGGVGHFAVQIAKILDAKVTAISGNGHEELLKLLNPDEYINYNTTDFKTQSKKYDVIFDVAGKESFLTTWKNLKPRGSYITTIPRPKLLIHKLLALLVNRKVKTLLMKALSSDLEIVGEWILNGKLNVIIDSIFPLAEVSKAHKKAEEYHAEGKIIVEI